MLQWIRSITFVVLATVYMPVVGLIYAPWAMFSKRGAYAGCKAYARGTMWMAEKIVGLRCEVEPALQPQGVHFAVHLPGRPEVGSGTLHRRQQPGPT